MRRNIFILISFLFLFSFNSFSQCTNCDDDVLEIDLDLRDAIDTVWSNTDFQILRNAHCCGATGASTCVKFNIKLNEQTEQLKFEMANPAPNGAAARYWIDCDLPKYDLATDVCIAGKTEFCLVYCKNGNDPNASYTISVGRTTKASSDISLVAGCIDSMFVQGMSAGTIHWTAVASTPELVTLYNSYLSSTTNDTIWVEAPTPIPDGLTYIDYAVSGQAAGCSSGLSRDTVRVNFIANSLQVQIAPDNPAICSDGVPILIEANGSGGTPPYSFLWSTGSIDSILLVRTSDIVGDGDFWVEISDTSDCGISRDTVNVAEFSLPIVANAGSDQTVCISSPTIILEGSIEVASGGTWTGGSELGFVPDRNDTIAEYTLSASEIDADSLTLTLTTTGNRGCPADSDEMKIYISQLPVLNMTMSTVSCFGENNGSANVSVSGGEPNYDYQWSNGSSTINTSSTSNAINSLENGDYCVTVTDDISCSTNSCITVTEPLTALSASITAQTNVLCRGNATGSATVTPAGGTSPYTFLWNDSAPAQTTATASGLSAGNYTVTITDHNGCTTTVSCEITQPAVALSASITAQTNVLCTGNSTGSATVTPAGGAGGYIFLWNDPAPAQTNATATGLSVGNIVVTVTDANSCTTTATTNITEPAATLSANITAQTNVLCRGNSTGNITLTTTGGTSPYSFLWTGGQTVNPAINLAAGEYTVTVTDANGCTANDNTSITQPAEVLSANITAQTNVLCRGNSTGNITVTTSGGTSPYTFAWTGGQTVNPAINLAAGEYTVTVTDANGCTANDNTSITQPAAAISASITAQTNVLCRGNSTGSATVTPAGGAGGYIFLWNDPAPAQTNATATGLSAGNIVITVTDANSCTTTATTNITEPAANLSANITAQTNVLCRGNSTGNITLTTTGGTSPYSFAWTGGQTVNPAINLAAGEYTVTVTDTNGCTANDNTSITQPAEILSANITAQTNVLCRGNSTGNITVTTSGGTSPYTFAWTGGQTVNPAINLAAGEYTVTVTDANGCMANDNTSITQPAAVLSASISDQTDVSCKGQATGNATVTAMNGTPGYSYLWSDGQAVNPAINLIADDYIVTVTDANGCEVTANVTITEPDVIMTASITAESDVTCNGLDNGSATVTPAGGDSPYSYAWNSTPIQNTVTASNLAPGNYTVTITDANGCNNVTASVNITEPSELTVSITTLNNVSCNAGNNGNLTVTAGGGTTPYTYLWTGGQTTNPAVNLSVGEYTITVTDANSCTETATTTITEPSVLTASITAQTNVSCYAGNNGSATVTAGGGAGSYTYLWTGGQTTNPATNLTAGSYTVTITDANLCTKTTTATITQPSVITASITAQTNVSCNAGSNGSATVTAGGGAGSYTYLWTGGQTTNPATNLTAGLYTVTVTDANSCTKTTTATITQPTLLTATISSQTNVSCNGDNDGALTATGGGGTTPYSFAWDNGQLTSSINTLIADNYEITITDFKNCTATTSATISEPSILTAAITAQTNISCNGGNNGNITVTAGGGTSPYTYLWTGGQTINPATNLVAGNYTVTVTDAHGCTETDNITLTQPLILIATITAKTDVNCFGGNNGTATVTAGGGTTPYSYLWTGGQTINPAVNLIAGTYTATVTDGNGCTKTTSSTITQPAVLTAIISSQTNPGCNGDNTGSATVTAGGGTPSYTYLWTGGQTTNPATNLIAGAYIVTVTDDNGCTKTTTATISEPDELTASITAKTDVSCFDGTDGTATVTPVGGTTPYSFLWNDPAPAQTTSIASNLSEGNYEVIVTDNSGCTKTISTTITEPTELILTPSHINASCGDSNGSASITAVGGTSPYSFNWSSGESVDAISGKVAGTYTVTVTDANGCEKIENISINNDGSPTATISSQTNVTCNGGNDGEAIVTPSGGTAPYTYLWTGGGTDSTKTNMTAESYTVTITDGNTCISSANVTIDEPDPIDAIISAKANVSCNGGSNGTATVLASGGVVPYSYLWSDAQLTATATNLAAGVYEVTVSQGSGCLATATASVTITEPNALTAGITSQTNVSCNGGSDGSATVTASDGTAPYSFLWNDPAPAQTTITATLLSAGNYEITITDNKGCTTTAPVTITEPDVLTATITDQNNISCNGGTDGSATVTAADGTSPYTYLWSDGQSNSIANNLLEGTYTVTITDGKNCTASTNVSIIEPDILSVSILSQINVSCNAGNDGSITATISGGTTPYSYNWTGGQTTNPAIGLNAGAYTITVTDDAGCTKTASTTLTQPNELIASISAQTNVDCNGSATGSLTVSAVGGTLAYSFLWSNAQTGATANNLIAGPYTVTITDSKGCTDSIGETVTENSIVTAEITDSTNVSCNGESTGNATVTASGGTLSYSYIWSDGQTTNIATNFAEGEYFVTVSDDNGCTATANVNITEPTILTASILSETDVSCNAGSDGESTVSGSGGTTPYTYLWTGGVTTQTLSNQISGIYNVTVTDDNSCTASTSVEIFQPTAISITNVNTNIYCRGDSTGAINLSVSGGTSPYTFAWSNGAATEDVSDLPAGNISITVTDDAGCNASKTITLTQPAVTLSASTSFTDVSCNGGSNGTATVSASGGTTPYSYSWTSGATTQTISNLTVGTYDVTITDNKLCTTTSSVSILEPTTLSAIISSKIDVSCNGGNNGTATVNASGGTSPYLYVWSGGGTDSTKLNMISGNYTVTITDAHACTTTANTTINQPTVLSANISAQTNVSCFSGNNGDATVNALGGTNPYTYLWSNAQNTITASNLTANTYAVTVTDSLLCQVSTNVTITQPDSIIINIVSRTNISCNGGDDGVITISVSGGETPIAFLWDDAQTDSLAINLSAGIHTVTITDANSCSLDKTITLSQPNILIVSATQNNVSCNGEADGSATATSIGGTPIYSYLWSNGASTGTASNLVAGNYIVTVTDSKACTDTTSITITQPAPVVPEAGNNQSICTGYEITLSATGGEIYSWNNSVTQDVAFVPLTTTTYTVTVTDSIGCSAIDSVTISLYPELIANAGNEQSICAGSSVQIGSTPTASGGMSPYSYLWNNSASLDNDTIANPITEAMTNTTYQLTITDANGCESTDDVLINVNLLPTVDAGLESVICEGYSYVLSGTYGGGASSVTWSSPTSLTGDAFNNVNDTAAIYTPTINDISNGLVVLTLTTNDPTGSCVAVSDSVTLSISLAPIVDAGNNLILCSNNIDINLNGSVTVGSTTGIWMTSGTGSFAPHDSDLTAEYIPTIDDISSGQIWLKLTSTNTPNCNEISDSISITFTDAPLVSAGSDTILCANNSELQLSGTVSGANSTGIWTTSGTGNFSPFDTTLSTIYTPSVQDTTNGTVTLYLTSTNIGTCNSITDSIELIITKSPYVFAGDNINMCPDVMEIPLEGIISAGATQGIWTKSGTGSFFPDNTSLNTTYTLSSLDTINGGVNLFLTSADNGNCLTVRDTLTISISSSIETNVSGNDIVCAHIPSISIEGEVWGNTNEGVWTTSGNGSFSPNDTSLIVDYIISPDDTLNGSVNLIFTSTNNGLCEAKSDTLELRIDPGIYVEAGNDNTVCANNAEISLLGNVWGGTTSGKWSSSGDGFFTPTDSSLATTYIPSSADTSNGFVTLYLESTNNVDCQPVVDSIFVTITPAPHVIAGTDKYICVNNPTVNLNGIIFGGSSSGYWTTNGTNEFSTDSTTLINTYLPSEEDTLSDNLFFVLTSTNNGDCLIESDTLNVYFTPAPEVFAGDDEGICSNSSFDLIGVVNGGAGTGMWTNITGSGNFNPDREDLPVTFIPADDDIILGYALLQLESTNTTGCITVYDTIRVSIAPSAIVEAGDSITICDNNSLVQLNGSVSGPTTTGIWTTNGDGIFATSDTFMDATYVPGPQDLVTGEITFILTSTNNGDCEGNSDSVNVEILQAPTVYAGPNRTVCKSLNVYQVGSVSGITSSGTWSSTGYGLFLTNTTQLAVYQPGAADIANEFVGLILTSDNNATCLAVADTAYIILIDKPNVNAGDDQHICSNNSIIQLNGYIEGATATWITNGSGYFIPDSITLDAQYISSPADTLLGNIQFILEATNSCTISDSLEITYTPSPIVDAGAAFRPTCIGVKNISMVGTVTGGATTGKWTTSGTGYFIPNDSSLVATYVRSDQDSIDGQFIIYLTATNYDNCIEVKDSSRFRLTTIPVVNAGSDFTYCANNANVQLNGIVNGGASTGMWTSSGTGTFSPSNTSLNAIYTPSVQDTTNGNATLFLRSTDACVTSYDTVQYSFTPAPFVHAGIDITVCANNNIMNLDGYVRSTSSTGKWYSTGSGIFYPNNTSLDAEYQPSTADRNSGQIALTLVSTNNGMCYPVKDTLLARITSEPIVDAGEDEYICKGDVIELSGSITGGATSGIWESSGSGEFSPNAESLTTNYIPSTEDTTIGFLTLTLTSTNNQNCIAVQGVKFITFTDKPTVLAGSDQTACANNSTIQLNGYIGGSSTTGIWSSLSGGSFTPSTTNLDADYTPGLTALQNGLANLVLTSTNACEVHDTVQLVFTNAPYVNAGFDQVFCISNPIVELDGTVSNGATSGIWETSGTGYFSPSDTVFDAIYYPSITDTLFGNITLSLTSTNNGNCIAENDEMTVSFVQKPIVEAGLDQIICANAMLMLDGLILGGISEGYWQTTGTGSFSPDSSDLYAVYVFSNEDTTNQYVPMILSTPEYHGCQSESDTMNVTITPAPHVEAGNDITVCANNSEIILNGHVWGSSHSGEWTTLGSGVFIPNDSIITATYLPSDADIDSGFVRLILKSTNNQDCYAERDTINVTISPSPEINAGNDQYVCNGNNVYLNATISGGATSGIWSTNGTGTITPSDTSLSITYIPSPADTVIGNLYFILTAQNYGLCNLVEDSIFITFTPRPYVEAGTDVIACANNANIVLDGIVNGSTITGMWATSGDGYFLSDSTQLDAQYIPGAEDVSSGYATLTLSSTYACLEIDSIRVSVTPAPNVNAGSNQVICNNEGEVFLAATIIGGASQGEWFTTGSGEFVPNTNDLNATYLVSPLDSLIGSFSLILTSTDNGDCLAESDTMRVRITTVPSVYAGLDQTVCANVITQLNGSIDGGNNSVRWITSGSGTFIPSDTARNAQYVFSPADTSFGNLELTLLSTGACLDITDKMLIDITPAPYINSWIVNMACANNDTVELHSEVSIAGGLTWSTITGGEFFESDTTLNPLYIMTSQDYDNGNIDFVLTTIDNGNCNAVIDTLSLNINPAPIVNAGFDQNICYEDLYVRLFGVISGGASHGTWVTNGTGTFSPSNMSLNAIYIPSLNDTTSAQNGLDFILTSSDNGSCIAVSDTMHVYWTEKPIVEAGNDVEICAYTDSISLIGNIVGSSTTGIWTSSGTGEFYPSNNDLQAVYLPSDSDKVVGNIVLTLTSTNSCSPESDNILLNIYPVPELNFTALSICNYNTVAFSNSSIINSGLIEDWYWNFGDGGIDSVKSPVHSFANISSFAVQLIATSDKLCSDTLTKQVAIRGLDANFTYQANCINDFVLLNDSSVVQNDSLVTWLWTFGDGESDTTQNTLHMYEYIDDYDVSLTVVTNTGCIDSISKEISIHPDPTAGFTYTPEIPFPHEEISFSDISFGATTWIWHFDDGSDSTSSQNPLHTYYEMNTYTVTQIVMNEYGCTDTMSVDLLVEGIVEPLIPAAFTPNNDTQNDILKVRGGPFSSVEMTIFNSWGKQLFHTENQNEGWDGTYKGKPQPIGVYIYIVNVKTIDGEEYVKKGDITLLR
ncbi:MAG TPA: hypothetical protein DDX39_06540 [Bacteroidales bacterium]|nr:hypothetical protein [Bacteroidales bacterium]